jgi:hypothetical protein
MFRREWLIRFPAEFDDRGRPATSQQRSRLTAVRPNRLTTGSDFPIVRLKRSWRIEAIPS